MQAQNISLTLPITQAMERVKTMLFRPFNAGKWFVVGFCAWLACLGENGFGGGGRYNFGDGHGGPNLREAFERARDYVMHNFAWLLPVVAAVLLLILVVSLVIVWLNSRGQFMFLHCVALNKAEVSVPWERYAREANSLFLFRLLVGSVGFLVMVPLMAGLGVVIWRMVAHGAPSVLGIFGACGLTFVIIAAAIVFGVIGKLTKDFVVPIQFIRRLPTLGAWRVLSTLAGENLAHFVLYLLFQIVLAIAIFACVAAVVVVTCCLAGCLLAIPYIGTVLFLPVLIFKRAYSLHYVAQYGSGFDVFQAQQTAGTSGA